MSDSDLLNRSLTQPVSSIPVYYIHSFFVLSILIAVGVLSPYKQPEQRASIRVPAVPSFIRTFSAVITVVPAATANSFGVATIVAHIAVAGVNLPALAINQVIGTSLFIRNLEPFTGGHPAYAVTFATQQDHLRATKQARVMVAQKIWGLHYPCKEKDSDSASTVNMTWLCQFITYHIPSYLHAVRAVLQGNSLVVDVVFVVHPHQIWVK